MRALTTYLALACFFASSCNARETPPRPDCERLLRQEDELIRSLDKDGDGLISRVEWKAIEDQTAREIRASHQFADEPNAIKQVIGLFDEIDVNKDGKLSRSELLRGLC